MATLGKWQGAWQGDWSGPIEGAPPGSMSGVATLSVAATGALTATLPEGFMSGAATFSTTAVGALTLSGSIVEFILSGGGGKASRWNHERWQAADEHEQRIKRQNETVLAFVMAAVTEGCL